MPSPVPVTRAEAIAKTCQAIEDVRLSSAATQHAIEQSRKSLIETHGRCSPFEPTRSILTGHTMRKSIAATTLPQW